MWYKKYGCSQHSSAAHFLLIWGWEYVAFSFPEDLNQSFHCLSWHPPSSNSPPIWCCLLDFPHCLPTRTIWKIAHQFIKTSCLSNMPCDPSLGFANQANHSHSPWPTWQESRPEKGWRNVSEFIASLQQSLGIDTQNLKPSQPKPWTESKTQTGRPRVGPVSQ